MYLLSLAGCEFPVWVNGRVGYAVVVVVSTSAFQSRQTGTMSSAVVRDAAPITSSSAGQPPPQRCCSCALESGAPTPAGGYPEGEV